MSSAIVVESVSKRFNLRSERATSLKELAVSRRKRAVDNGFWAVRDVSLEIAEGSTFGLIGHNGSGKSTLLRLMAGIHQPTEGSVTARGRISALLELGSGFHPDLTGRENVYLNGAMLGLARRDMDANIDDIVEFAGLQGFIDQPVKVYSSGMYVRLGFAVAVHVDPEILLVDEVMAVGDEEFQRRCLDHMYRLRRDGATIVFVSHSLGLVQMMCEEVAWLDHGRLMEVGPSSQVTQSYLSQVNAEEAGRRTEEMIAHDESRAVELTGEHSGSGELRVYHLDLLDPKWYPMPHATFGEELRMRLWYDARSVVRHPNFELDVFHENGTHVTGFSTSILGLDTGTCDIGQGYVDLVIPELSIHPGSYFLATRVTDAEGLHTFDEVARIADFHVVGTGTRERGIARVVGHFEPPVAHDVGL